MAKHNFDGGTHYPIKTDGAHGLLLVNAAASARSICYEASLNLEGALAVLDAQSDGEDLDRGKILAAFQLLTITKGLVDSLASRLPAN
jgi:hypothetical protein